MTRTKILISTDSHVLHTGLAETLRMIFYPLLDKYGDQYEIHQIGLFHANPIMAQRWGITPTRVEDNGRGGKKFRDADKYGQETFPQVVNQFKPDIVFGYGDPWYVAHMANNPKMKDYSLVLYLTYDGTPYPPNDQSWLKNADKFITLSNFSKRVITGCMPEVDPEKVEVMYSPADTQRFTVASEEEKQDLRRKTFPGHIPQDAFVLGWIGRNQWRKQVWKPYELMNYLRSGKYLVCQDCDAITPIDWDPGSQKWLDDENGEYNLSSPPGYKFDHCLSCKSENVEQADPIDDIFLWSHMAPEDRFWPIEMLHRQYNVGNSIFYTPQFSRAKGMPAHMLPNLFKSWDAMLYLSGGEGFGNPCWEAMCSGIPVIYTNYSSHGELVRTSKGGIGVGGILQPEQQSCIHRMVADTGQSLKAIRDLYFDRQKAKALGTNGRLFTEQYSPDKMVDKWHQIFQEAKNPTRTMVPSIYAQQV